MYYNLIIVAVFLLFFAFFFAKADNFLAIVGIIASAVMIFVILWRNKELKDSFRKTPEKSLHVVNLDKGGVFELKGVGDDMEDMSLTVLEKHLYQEGDFFWFELECDRGYGEKVWVEVEDDDKTVVSVVLKKLKLADLPGVTPEILEMIEEKEEGNISYQIRNSFRYEDSGDAVFYRFCDDSKSQKFHYWDFVFDNKYLSIEKWGDKDYEVFISQKMHPGQIRVLRNKGT